MPALLLLIIFIGCGSFSILPWAHVPGLFRLSDIGLLLIITTLTYQFLTSPHRHRCFNAAGLLIIAYILMNVLHVGNAAINYDQSIFRGLVQLRHQFYYLSYFVFLLAFARPGVAERFMKYFTGLAITIFVISLLNYAGIPLLHHEWADGHGARSGITRMYMPGMNVICMAFLWCLLCFTKTGKYVNSELVKVLVLFLALMLRQTRGRIIAALAASAWLMYREKKLVTLMYSAIVLLVLSLSVSVWTEENILFSALQTAYTDVVNVEGTWVGRTATIESALGTFYEHPIIGSGSSLIYGVEGDLRKEFRDDAFQADLGYVHWIKNFGTVGILWLIALFFIVARQSLLNRKLDGDNTVAIFAEYQMVQIAFGFITINYLVKSGGILVFCLALSLLYAEAASKKTTNTSGTEL